MCFSKRKRTTPTNEAKAYTLRKTYFIQYVLLKRINMKNILFVYAFLASGGSREPCHRFQRCKIEEPRPYGREHWHFVLEKLFYLFFSALAASIILFAWSCGTSSYLTKSIWKEPLACVIALRSIAYLNISE